MSAGASKEHHSSGGFSRDVDPPVAILLPMPSATALAIINADEAFSAASLGADNASLGLTIAAPQPPLFDGGARWADQNKIINAALDAEALPRLPARAELPLMVCPYSPIVPFCEVPHLG